MSRSDVTDVTDVTETTVDPTATPVDPLGTLRGAARASAGAARQRAIDAAAAARVAAAAWREAHDAFVARSLGEGATALRVLVEAALRWHAVPTQASLPERWRLPEPSRRGLRLAAWDAASALFADGLHIGAVPPALPQDPGTLDDARMRVLQPWVDDMIRLGL